MKRMIMAVAAATLAILPDALLAQDATPPAPPPPADRIVIAPPPYPAPPYYYPYPYYAPYYAPGYVAPGWGVSVCAGRAFRHGFGSFCI